MTCMRTTLTLDDDVVRLVEDAVHRERRPMKQVINDALRRALAPPVKRQEQYRLEPHESAVRSGLIWPASTSWPTNWRMRRCWMPRVGPGDHP